MRVFVAGSSGAIGRPLVAELVRAGHSVVGMTRNEAAAQALRAAGAEPVVCDVFNRDGVASAITKAAPDAVVHQLTAIPKRIDPRHAARDLAATNRLRVEGTRNLLDASKGVKRFIAQSVAFAYEPGPGLHVESDPLYVAPDPRFAPILDAVKSLEQQVGAAANGVVLRYGYFYGPGTVYAAGGSFHEDVRRRRIPLPGAGSGVFSFIHVEDAATATRLALESKATGTFNIVDDEPAALKQWLPEYARAIGAPAPWRVPGFLARLGAGPYGVYLLLRQPGASNAKARRELLWSPLRDTWREGFVLEAKATRVATSASAARSATP